MTVRRPGRTGQGNEPAAPPRPAVSRRMARTGPAVPPVAVRGRAGTPAGGLPLAPAIAAPGASSPSSPSSATPDATAGD